MTLTSEPARPPDPSSHVTPDDLGERERLVLSLVARGWSNMEIAEELALGIAVVKADLRSVLARIGVTGRAEASWWSLAHGLLRADVGPDGPRAS